ncbi:sugar-binding transcriptional regulator [Devosia honganensis]|uniref:Sugar-binding transcriptional regulator n=1 Tax=Devosia honganensis TaxID=1610527 RepID=A0ABV7WYC7_9HYPH
MNPEETERQMHIRAAWLYYMEGMTQADIAHILGTTRLKINRILSEARTDGLVNITINSPLVSTVALERELIRDFNLADAVIIPTPAEGSQTQNLLGKAAAQFVSQYIARNTVRRFGIGWGGTLREMVNQLPVGNYSDMTVISIMGGLTHGAEFNTFNIVSDMARRLGARCEYLAAPIYASSERSRNIILEQDVFRHTFEEIEKADLVVVSIGDATNQSLLISRGIPPDASMEDLRDAGAVTDICGHFLDEHGVELEYDLNRRAITVSLDALRKIPMRVFAAGGAHKTQAIAAVLRSGLISVLISDEDTARKATALARS